MKAFKNKVIAGRFVISKSKTRKKGYFTEMVVYKTQTSRGKFASRTRHERVI
jgi:hypothetical protein